MRKWISIAAVVLNLHHAFADTPPARVTNSETYDAAGNAITSTVNGGKRGLDTYNINPASAPLNTQIIWSGSPIDPRQINATQAGSWVIDSHTQDSGGTPITSGAGSGPWSGHVGLDVNIVNPPPNGTVIANQGAAASYTMPWFFEISDGARVVNVTPGHALTVDGSATVQPVAQSGTWNVNALQSGAWTVGRSWTLSNPTDTVGAVESGVWSMRAQDGSGNPITSTTIGGSHQALDVNAIGVATSVIGDLSNAGTITTTCTAVGSISGACPAGSTVDLNLNGVSSAQVQITGTYTGASLSVDGTIDGVNWVELLTGTGPSGVYTQTPFDPSISASGKYRVFRIAGLTAIRVRANALTSGTVGVKINASLGGNVQETVSLSPSNFLSSSWLSDGAGTPITSQASGSQRALDVGINVGGTQVDPRTRTWNLSSGSDAVAAVQSGTWTVQQGGAPWSVSQSGAWTVQQGGAPWSVSQSGTWNINNISGTVSLPTNAAQESGGHLASIDAKFNSLGQKTMANSTPVAIASDQSAIPASQSGTWNVNAVQSGTWSVTANAGTGTFTTSDLADGPVGAGTAATKSLLMGGIFNTVPPTLTNGQQAALQVDSGGRLLVGAVISSLPAGSATIGAVTQASGPWTQNLTQVGGSAVALGQTTMASSFPVVIASNQTAVPASQSGAWTTGRTWTLSSGTDSVAAAQSGAWTVGQSGAWVVKAQLQDNAGTAITVGQKTMASSFPVVISSDQTAVPASQSGSWTVTANAGTGTFTTSDLADGSVGAGTAGTRSLLGGAVFNTALPTLTNGQQAALQADSSGRLIIRPLLSGTDAVSAVQSGAWTTGRTWSLASGSDSVAAIQSGTWNINNVSGTVSLPTGASTETTLAKLTQTQGSTTSGQSGPLVQGAVTTAAPTYTTAQTSPLSLTTGGALRVDNTTIAGNAVSTGNGVAGTGVQRVAIASDNTAFSVKPGDGTRTITVKAASTAAVAADTSEVVALSPNTPLPAGTNVIGALSANQTVNLAQVAGTNTVTAGVSGLLAVGGNVASGATDSGNPVKAGGVYNSTPVSLSNGQRGDLQLGPQGQLVVAHTDGVKATYRAASVPGLALAGGATDFFTITGSATKTVRITAFAMLCTQNTAATNDIVFLKRSTADTGGTSTTRTAVPLDSTNPAATATVRTYTANPTTGTLVGNLMTTQILFSVPGGGASSQPVQPPTWHFGDTGQAIVLRGTGEVFAVNFNGQTAFGNSCDMWAEWTEE